MQYTCHKRRGKPIHSCMVVWRLWHSLPCKPQVLLCKWSGLIIWTQLCIPCKKKWVLWDALGHDQVLNKNSELFSHELINVMTLWTKYVLSKRLVGEIVKLMEFWLITVFLLSNIILCLVGFCALYVYGFLGFMKFGPGN